MPERQRENVVLRDTLRDSDCVAVAQYTRWGGRRA